MAARRGKNQARRSGQGTRSGMVWLAAGLALGGIAYGYLHLKDKAPLNSLLPQPNPNAQAPAPTSESAVADAAERPRPKYDFYTLLPEKEVVIPDAELDAEARAEEARAKAAAAKAAAAAAAGEAPASTETLSLDGSPPPVANAAPGESGAPAPAPASDGPRYLIQAGAFRGSTEAEALKAQIALTGEIARVEIAEINGNTVHRVRMGPYPNAASLAAAKAALAAHGITAQAIRAK